MARPGYHRSGIEFTSGLDRHLIEPTGTIPGKTLWYCEWRDCGAIGFKSLWKGFGTGCNFFVGTSHIQAGAETLIDTGGAECVLFGNDSKVFWDSGNAQWAASGLPWLRTCLPSRSSGRR